MKGLIIDSILVSQLTNQVLLDGKKDTARNIVYKALELVEKQAGGDPLNVLKEAFENVKPQIETKSRRVGGTNYQVPMEVPQKINIDWTMPLRVMEVWVMGGCA